MKTIINKRQLAVYQKYGGDIDGLLRYNNQSEIEVFNNEIDTIWPIITNKLQDLKLVNEKLASKEYAGNSLLDLKAICDEEAFGFFMAKIIQYETFRAIVTILKTIKDKISTDTDTVWTGFDNSQILESKITSDIEKIGICDYETLEQVRLDFLPTSTYQELSLSNGWANEYLEMASQFDSLYSKISDKDENIEQEQQWWKFW